MGDKPLVHTSDCAIYNENEPAYPALPCNCGLEQRLRAENERLREALRAAFPHFQDDADVTPARIERIGMEYAEIVLGWEPVQTYIEFFDDDGDLAAISFEHGDPDVGIRDGWVQCEVETPHALEPKP